MENRTNTVSVMIKNGVRGYWEASNDGGETWHRGLDGEARDDSYLFNLILQNGGKYRFCCEPIEDSK